MTLAPDDPRHGTRGGYSNHGCRCDACRAENTRTHREWTHRIGKHRPEAEVFAERRAAAALRDNHGTEYGYVKGCRCPACTEASRLAKARRRRRAAKEAWT